MEEILFSGAESRERAGMTCLQVHRPAFQTQVGIGLAKMVRQGIDHDQPYLFRRDRMSAQIQLTCERPQTDLVVLDQPRFERVHKRQEFDLRCSPDQMNTLEDVLYRG